MLLDPDNVRQNDLRGGTSPWSQKLLQPVRPQIEESFRCDVLVVGAGITGSLAAEHLACLGHDVCVIDRQRPGLGSTTASTAMLLWEIDRSLSDLTEMYGFERAASIYRHSQAAVSGLIELVTTRGLACDMRPRHSLYLTAGDSGPRELLAEHDLRIRAGLPGDFLDHQGLLREFKIHREAALVSPGSADADPVLLSQALLAEAVRQKARLLDAEAVGYDSSSDAVIVVLDSGHVIEAKHVVLATGYVMPDILTSDLHKVVSSWAIATPPQATGALWRDSALIWEASDPYSYLRTTVENRIIMGGEDDDAIVEPEARDRLMPEKAKVLLGKLQALWPKAEAIAEFVWSGAFGTTSDGLPLIGAVPGHPRIHAAYGYGGNGITYSYLASRMIAASIAGNNQPWFDDFAIDRDAPKGS
ncbi:FAD-binding oxidoreductase [Bradyrhizobium sp. G127]|uniref:NAD(P)/FAD-dependent oxidoreductase n=1 Tax=Bradyrhizobium sp. G127 TaxID=2904800 RepID=UPI001F203E3C|nr:FAD-binding oxidoreductase [Bradyrhizobium sp. G127]MCF2522845.1 FAD-binding oxidoreductase [Bradyrhizobium sp. G127]